jgi:hypothetical protein
LTSPFLQETLRLHLKGTEFLEWKRGCGFKTIKETLNSKALLHMNDHSSEGTDSPSGPQKESKKDRLRKKLAKAQTSPAKPESEKDNEAPAPVPIRPRTAIPKRREVAKESDGDKEPEEKKKEQENKEKASRLKPSGKPFLVRRVLSEKTSAKVDQDEDESDDEESSEPEAKSPESPAKKGASLLSRLFRIRISLGIVLIVLVFLAIGTAFWFYGEGVSAGKSEAEALAQKEPDQIPTEVLDRVDAAVFNLRNGHSADALKTLSDIEATNPYPSLTYLVALAALEGGDFDLVERKAQESIKKREKVSDSLALLAVVESQRANDPARLKIGNSVRRAEGLLRQAISADPANPYPRFELTTLLRYDRRREEAVKELQGARSLLNPSDSHLVMGITAQIMALELKPLDQLPTKSDPSDNPQKLIPAAYAAMRLGDFPRAVTLLRAARQAMSAESFDYLVNDPSLRRYSRESQLAEFYPAN